LFRIQLKKRIGLYLLLGLVVVFIITRNDENLSTAQLVSLYVLAPVCTVGVGLLNLFIIARLSGRRYLKQKNVRLGDRTYTMNDDRFHQESEQAQSSVVWSAIISLRESKNYYYLFIDRASAFIIPKRHFTHAQHEAAFIDFIKARIGKK
jgi:hypothetical protein